MYDPAPSRSRDVLSLINEIPRAYHRLSAIAEDLFADLGLGPPERGALRDLFVEGESAVPDLARRKAVSRQSVQAVLDRLVAKGFVRTEINPRHKRSRHYVLTQAGIETCVEIQRREMEKIGSLLSGAGDADFAKAAAAVASLNAVLAADLDQRR
jgi:MarR family 2-MHQ and catechol resistance regulon transcriptional repressor